MTDYYTYYTYHGLLTILTTVYLLYLPRFTYYTYHGLLILLIFTYFTYFTYFIAKSSTSPSPYVSGSPSQESSFGNKRASAIDREIQAIVKNPNIVSADQLYNSEREKYTKAIPTGVLLKSDGGVKVFFTLTGAEYEVRVRVGR